MPARATGGRRLRVLLAEDNEVNQELAVRMLEKRGHAVTVAGNGREALAALGGGAFDLVLMDVQMPEMDGLEATAAIREREAGAGRHIPVIALTAHAMKGDRERCLAAGMDGYLSKPIRTAELSEAIARLGLAPAAGGEVAPAAFDPARALALAEGDRAFLGKLVGLLCDQAPKLLAAMLSAAAAADGRGLERAAHKLKGSAVNFGAAAVAAAAERLERMGRAGDFTGTEEALCGLGQDVPALCRALAEFTKG